MGIKKLSSLIAVFVIIGVFIIVKRSTKIERDPRMFIVGTAAGYAPFVSINEKGEYEGFDIDVAHALAKQMGKQLVIKDYGSMTSLFVALDQGMVDALIWGLSITKERLEKCAMIHYQGSAIKSYPLIFWKSVAQEIASLADMKGKTVCVEPASAQYAVLKEYPEINVIPTEKVDDALLTLSYGKADAALVEGAIAQKFKKLYPEIQIINVAIPEVYHENGCGIVVKKGSSYVIDDISLAVAQLKSKGIITDLEQKWGITE